jgi:phosphoserine aminotransferase
MATAAQEKPGRATDRIFNFGAGPAILPTPVLEEAQRDLLSLPGVGMAILECSHRA